MKHILNILSVVVLMSGFVQTAQAQIGGKGVGGQDDFYVASDNDIAETIQNLSRQSQQQEAQLFMLTNNDQPGFIVPPTYHTHTSGHVLALRPITSQARTSSGFGYRQIFGKTTFHAGIDFAAPTGTPIYATGDGIVTFSGWGNGYGRYIEIDHGNGLVTRYAHNSRNLVNVGDTVYANQHIADVGSTGRSTGPHLHYEVRRNGRPINPQTYLALAPAR